MEEQEVGVGGAVPTVTRPPPPLPSLSERDAEMSIVSSPGGFANPINPYERTD